MKMKIIVTTSHLPKPGDPQGSKSSQVNFYIIECAPSFCRFVIKVLRKPWTSHSCTLSKLTTDHIFKTFPGRQNCLSLTFHAPREGFYKVDGNSEYYHETGGSTVTYEDILRVSKILKSDNWRVNYLT